VSLHRGSGALGTSAYEPRPVRRAFPRATASRRARENRPGPHRSACTSRASCRRSSAPAPASAAVISSTSRPRAASMSGRYREGASATSARYESRHLSARWACAAKVTRAAPDARDSGSSPASELAACSTTDWPARDSQASREKSSRRFQNVRYRWSVVRSSSVPASSPCQAASRECWCSLTDTTSASTLSPTRPAAS
jgi:hypothetical protein